MKRVQLLTLLCVLMGLVACCAAYGQSAGNTRPVSIDFNGIGIRTAITMLFRGSGLSDVIDSSVTDSKIVTTTLTELPFDTALQRLLDTDDLTYSVSGNVYTIGPKKPDVVEQMPTQDISTNTETTVKPKDVVELIPVGNADVMDMYNMLLGRIPSASGRFGAFGGGGFGSNSNNGSSGFGNGSSLFGSNNNNSNNGYGNSNSSSGLFGGGGLFGSSNNNNNSNYNSGNSNNSTFRL